jgi:hypothetical protein
MAKGRKLPNSVQLQPLLQSASTHRARLPLPIVLTLTNRGLVLVGESLVHVLVHQRCLSDTVNAETGKHERSMIDDSSFAESKYAASHVPRVSKDDDLCAQMSIDQYTDSYHPKGTGIKITHLQQDLLSGSHC